MDIGHILVVDDEAEVRDLLQEYLSKQAFRVSTAESVPVARAMLDGKASGADLIILDLCMPGESGLVLARELRSRSNVAIIMLTASGETIDRVVGLEIGADDYMAKPFQPRELLARIRSVLRRTRTMPDAMSASVGNGEKDPAAGGGPLRPLPARSGGAPTVRARPYRDTRHGHAVRPDRGVPQTSQSSVVPGPIAGARP
jgi:DNA-binding response OmpR family regulator